MASTDDMAPSRASTSSSTTARAPARRRSPQRRNGHAAEPATLEAQVDRLQDDVKSILQTLTRMGGDKVDEAQTRAKREAAHLVERGEGMLESVQDEFTQVEKQIKDTIRAKPLTAVLSAMGIGFLIAVLTR